MSKPKKPAPKPDRIKIAPDKLKGVLKRALSTPPPKRKGGKK